MSETTHGHAGDCQCEHELYTAPADGQHLYAAVKAVSTVKTPYGAFQMCRQCIADRHYIVGGERDHA